jgi:DNA invertase Pin-like site-specific DNA recombinase
MALIVAYARVSTASGEQLSALDAQIAWLEAQGPDVLLSDVESGRVVSRANYQQLRAMVERGQVGTVLATSLSRLGRDATESDAFVALCDARGVVVTTRDEGRLSMATPEDLLLTRLRGSLNQGESMRISQRVRRGLEQGRAMRKPMRKPCWGYRLRADRLVLEPDPEAWLPAQRFIDTLQAGGWRMFPALTAHRDAVPFRSVRGVRAWLLNPTLRGGIGYQQGRNHTFAEVHWEQHPALLTHAQFADFERQVQQNRRLWGTNVTRQPRILTSLVTCAECGNVMKYISGRTIPSLRCYGDLCSQLYKGTREAVIVAYAIDAIREHAAERLAALATQGEPPEARELRRQIESLERLADPDLAPVIAAKQQRLDQVLTRPSADGELVRKLADPAWWDEVRDDEIAAMLRAVVSRIVVARQEPIAVDLRL